MQSETPDPGADLESARHRYEDALAGLRRAEEICGDLGGQTHPDGHSALRVAHQEWMVASEEFRHALQRFSEQVLHRARGVE